MYSFASSTVDLNQLRERLRKMNDADLLRFGNAARFMCSPQANSNEPPRESFVVQLKEAQAEWRRRKVTRGADLFRCGLVWLLHRGVGISTDDVFVFKNLDIVFERNVTLYKPRKLPLIHLQLLPNQIAGLFFVPVRTFCADYGLSTVFEPRETIAAVTNLES
jgi:hypothetical protein